MCAVPKADDLCAMVCAYATEKAFSPGVYFRVVHFDFYFSFAALHGAYHNSSD